MSTAPGLEKLDFVFRPDITPDTPAQPFRPVLVGVVGSGNLEVMIEPSDGAALEVHVETSARGFSQIWEAVVSDFHKRHSLHGVRVLVNDMGATPAVVGLRLDQAVAEMKGRAS